MAGRQAGRVAGAAAAMLLMLGCASATPSPTPGPTSSASLGSSPHVTPGATSASSPTSNRTPSATLAPSPTTSPSPTAGTGPTAAPSPSDASAIVRIPLEGGGPLGLDVDGDTAWVSLADSGELAQVDLAGRSVVRRIPIGGSAQHALLDRDGTVWLDLVLMDPGSDPLVTVDAASGSVGGVATEPLGGFAIEGKDLWALGKSGRIVRIDRPTLEILPGSVSVHVDEDAHMDAIGAAGAAWVSGDRTPLHRVEGPEPHVVADIETGGGIPLSVDGGLVWGARPDQVWAVDPRTNTVTRHVPLDGVDEILGLDVSGDDAWIAVRHPGRLGAVLHVDLTDGSILSDDAVGLPAGVAIADDRVWVTDYESSQLVGLPR